MSYSARAYPYPILAPFSQDFASSPNFDFSISVQPLGADIADGVEITWSIPVDVHQKIQEFFIDSSFQWFMDVECTTALYREMLPITPSDKRIEIPGGLLIGSLTVTPILVSTEAQSYAPPGLSSEFLRDSFEIMRGDPVVIGESETFLIQLEKVSRSNFLKVELVADLDPDEYNFVFEEETLVAQVGKNVHLVYEIMRSDPEKKPYLFLSLYKDALYFAAREIQSSEASLEKLWAARLSQLLDGLEPGWSLDKGNEPAINGLVTRLLATAGIRKVMRNVD